MKKMSRFFAAAVMALAAFVSAQAVELTVFDGTETSRYDPINIYYNNLSFHSQVIFPESALAKMVGCEINSIKFYLDRTIEVTNSGLLRISMGMTDKDRFDNGQDCITEGLTPLTDLTIPNGISELKITFDQPFLYNGGNLVFDCNTITPGDAITGFFYGIIPDYYSAVAISLHNPHQFLPKTTFDFTPNQAYLATVTPQELNFGDVSDSGEVTQTVTLMNAGLNAFTPSFGAIAAPFSINAQPVELASGQMMEISVTFNAASPGTFANRFIIDCGKAGVISVPVTATYAPEVVVADGTDKNNNIPIKLDWYHDAKANSSQMIYPASMLTVLNGKKLNSLRFYADADLTKLSGGKVQVSLKEVDFTEFADVHQVTGMTVVAEVTPIFNGNEMQLTFDTPFDYKGGNLAVKVGLTEPGNRYIDTKFIGMNMDESVSFYWSYDNNSYKYNLTQFLPKAAFSYVDNGFEFEKGDVNMDGSINIADVTALIDYLLRDASAAPAEADVNGDHSIDISDVTALIDYLLSGTWPTQEMVYTVVGPESVFGGNWDLTDEANDMVKGEDGIYTWTKSRVALGGNFEFKVVGNHDWYTYEWPIGMDNNWIANVDEAGVYDVTITFNPQADDADRIACTLTGPFHVYTVAGTYNLFDSDWEPADERNDMVKGEDGIYTWNKDGVYLQAGDVIEFKVVQDHSWDKAWPSSNWHYEVAEAGVYGFVIKFNPEADDANKVSFYATKLI